MAVGLALAHPVVAGYVLTRDGQRYEGEVRVEDHILLVLAPGAGSTKVNLTNLSEAVLRPQNKETLSAPPPVEEPQPGYALPPPWASVDLGNPKLKGSASYRVEGSEKPTSIFSIQSGGLALGGRGDSCHFVYQPLRGNGEVLARVSNLQYTDRLAMVGVMMRATLESNAPCVTLALSAGAGAFFQERAGGDREARSANIKDVHVPHWFKLEREENQFTGFRSKDGITWEELGRTSLPMPKVIYAGVASASAKENIKNHSQVSKALVLAAPEEPYTPKVVFRDGTALSARVHSAGGGLVRFSVEGRTFAVASNQVARFLFRPLAPELEAKVKAGQSGVLLRRGEFVEGTLQAIDLETVQLKTRQGLRTCRLGSEVAAVILRETVFEPVRFEVKLVDGACLYAPAITLEPRGISVELAGLGVFSYAAASVAEIRRLGNAAANPATPVKGAAAGEDRRAQVSTCDGKIHTGEWLIETGALLVKSGGATTRLELKDIQRARFDAQIPFAFATKPVGPGFGGWDGRDLGATRLRGKHRYQDEVLTIEGGGAGNTSDVAEPFYFVNQAVEGNIELAARLASLQSTHESAKAGLLILEKLEAKAKGVLLAATPGKGLVFQRRYGDWTDQRYFQERSTPRWLRLEREGKAISAYESGDGHKWSLLEVEDLELPAKVQVGFVVASRNDTKLNRAVFEQLSFYAYSPAAFKPRLVLRGGSEIACTLTAADDTAFRFLMGHNEEYSISALQVARVLLQPLSPQLAASLKPGRAGLLLRNGDFLEGEFRSLDKDTVRISSVVFGLRSYKIGNPAVAAVLRDPMPVPAPFQILLKDGSRFQAHSVRLQPGSIALRESSTGCAFEVAAQDLAEIAARLTASP